MKLLLVTILPLLLLSPKLNLITRYVIPIVDQHDITCEGEDEFGLSDAPSAVFSHLRYR
jgi:hypothetical protein